MRFRTPLVGLALLAALLVPLALAPAASAWGPGFGYCADTVKPCWDGKLACVWFSLQVPQCVEQPCDDPGICIALHDPCSEAPEYCDLLRPGPTAAPDVQCTEVATTAGAGISCTANGQTVQRGAYLCRWCLPMEIARCTEGTSGVSCGNDATVTSGPGYCMDYYWSRSVGPATVTMRDSCHVDVYVNGENVKDLLA